jgi:hypothetical protein
MARFVNAIIATAAIAATTLVPVTQSYAHDRHFGHHHGGGNGGWGNNGWGNGGWDEPRHNRRNHRNRPVGKSNGNNDALLLGVLGLAAGAIITGAILTDPARQRNRAPQRRYIAPAPNAYPDYPSSAGQYDPGYYPPAPANSYAVAGSIEPWTDEWYRYCAQKYRSFKPGNGTFRGYDGQDHFCVAR